MTYESFCGEVTAFLLDNPMNRVSADDAIREDLVGMQIYDAPIFAVAAADDPLFEALRRPGAVHPDYPLPQDWLEGARCVVSFFAPYTERVRRANAVDFDHPSDEWLHARIEGEACLREVRIFAQNRLREAGYGAVAPFHDGRFAMLETYASNWSERHTAYIAGLGTFCMSKGLITAKGVAGRFGSVLTDADFPVTERPYKDVYEYCTACGLCAAHCPADAIDPGEDMDHAKAHPPCDVYISAMNRMEPRGRSRRPRYGCGKCQVAVPCEARIPAKPR